jgi:hypothetical protein
VPLPGLVIALACLVIGWLLTSVTADEWIALAVALAVGVVLYFSRPLWRNSAAA